jgi:thioredoxin 1
MFVSLNLASTLLTLNSDATKLSVQFDKAMGLETRVSDKIVYLSDDSFESDVIQADVPVLVDYWAEWCGPCKMIAPILEEIADEYDGRLTVAKLNIDENSNTPPKYGIRGIPTLMLFKGGEVEATKVGALSKSQLTAFLDSNI